MSTITFDTLKFTKTLQKAGFPAEQAEAIAQAQSEALSEATTTSLATRRDIEELRYEVRMTKWMVGLSLALSVGILSILTKLFFALPH